LAESDKSQEERNNSFCFQVQRHSIAFSSRAELDLKFGSYTIVSLFISIKFPQTNFGVPPRQCVWVYSRSFPDWPGAISFAKQGNGFAVVFVGDFGRQRGSDPPPNVSSLYNMLRRKPLAINATMVFPASSEKHPAI